MKRLVARALLWIAAICLLVVLWMLGGAILLIGVALLVGIIALILVLASTGHGARELDDLASDDDWTDDLVDGTAMGLIEWDE